jgi:hypothetical protein
MQAEVKPSRWRVMGAQGLAYLLTGIIAIVLLFLLGSILPAGISSSLSGLLFIAIISGAVLAALQRSILRKWLPQNWKWILISGAAMPVLLLGEYFLFTRLLVNSSMVSQWFHGEYSDWYRIQPVILRLSLVGGFVVGAPGGLIFGLIQAYFLPWHRRMWWGISSLGWALIGALLLALHNLLVFVFQML